MLEQCDKTTYHNGDGAMKMISLRRRWRSNLQYSA